VKHIQDDFIQKIAVAFGKNKIVSAEIEGNAIILTVKDTFDSFFRNNFEEEVAYDGPNDPRRVVEHVIQADRTGWIKGTGIHVGNFYTIDQLKEKCIEFDKEITDAYNVLKRMIG
jgi:hypothetical protein